MFYRDNRWPRTCVRERVCGHVGGRLDEHAGVRAYVYADVTVRDVLMRVNCVRAFARDGAHRRSIAVTNL